MNDRLRATALAAALVVGATALPQPAAASSFARTAVPVVLWAATGAAVGAVVWPMLFPTTVGAAATAGPSTISWASFQTTRAAVGAAIGAVLGYTIAP